MESFPPAEVTRYGITLLKEGIEPHITYISPDGDVAFYLNGGLAPWPGVTEGVVLADGMSGMHATFNHLDHKGARQDGSTWADTVYDPAEMNMDVICTARTPENLRKVIRQWIASWDPQKRGTLSWVTPEGGEWWCHPRLMRAPADKMSRTMARSREQKFSWSIRNDDAFWRSHDSVGVFGFSFNKAYDDFNRDDSGTLGPNWSQTYSNPGHGHCETEDDFFGNDSFGRAVWIGGDNAKSGVINRWLGVNEIQTITVAGAPSTWTLTYLGVTTAAITHPATAATVQTALQGLSTVGAGNAVVTGNAGGPYTVTFQGALAKRDIDTLVGTVTSGGTNPVVRIGRTKEGSKAVTETDNQVITVTIADFFSFPFPETGYIDIWGRMSADGTSGIRARIGGTYVALSSFKNGVERPLFSRPLLLTPLWWEQWTLVCGTAANSREFKLFRANGFQVFAFTEPDTDSYIGSGYRGGGFGLEADAGFLVQAIPPGIQDWAMGDNLEVTQSGHVNVTNFGDQDGYPDLVVYGPGMFKFGDGPGTEPTIEFGPLLEGQVALIKTHPGKRAVYDLTADKTPQQLPAFQDFISRLISLAFNNNIPPLFSWFESIFGIAPPQGNLYALLKGRFTKPVPARPVIGVPETSHIAIEVQNGNAFTRVVAALTPLRRWPE